MKDPKQSDQNQKNDSAELRREIADLKKKITQSQQAQEALAESEKRYKFLVNSSNEIILTLSKMGKILFANNTALRNFGYTEKEIIGKPVTRFLTKSSIKKSLQSLAQEFLGNSQPAMEIDVKTKSGDIKCLNIASGSTFVKEKGKLVGILISASDVTESKESQEQLQKNEAFNFALFQYNPIPTIIVDKEGKVLKSNLAERKTGERLPDIRDVMYRDYAGKHKIDMYAELMECIRSGKKKDFPESKYNDKYLNISIAPFHGGAIITSRDITSQIKAKNKITASLKEKEVLLQEVHHRVKNNMQIITSLLRLQSRIVKDDKIVEILQVCQNRIRSMALIHDSLYRAGDLSKIKYSDYLRKLTTHLLAMHREKFQTVNLDLDIEDIYLDINQAIPCGLIVNELVSNSLKHAFPGTKKGKITVKMSKNKQGKYTLIIKDTGIGFHKDVDINKSETLGMQLVSGLIKQLNSTLSLKRTGGTEFKITF